MPLCRYVNIKRASSLGKEVKRAKVDLAEAEELLENAEAKLAQAAKRPAPQRIKGPHGAAAGLGLLPSTLYPRMQKLGIPHRHQKDKMQRLG